MIQERLGIVNQANRFSQRAWHDSPYDFDWFIKQNMEKSRILFMNMKKASSGRSLKRAIPSTKATHKTLYLSPLYQMHFRM